MRDSLLEQERLTTADIARPATPRPDRAEAIDPNQPDGTAAADHPTIQLPAATPPAKGTGDTAASTDASALFPHDELYNYRARWDRIQTSFVDEPRQAVEQADSLVANVITRIAEQFAAERAHLEDQWARGDNANTEDLRQALRRYRSFFDRLLSF